MPQPVVDFIEAKKKTHKNLKSFAHQFGRFCYSSPAYPNSAFIVMLCLIGPIQMQINDLGLLTD